MSRLADIIANHLQTLYERNRVPETWGSPQVSGPTFDQLRQRGFLAAFRYLFRRLREVGRPDWSPLRKFAALIVGIGLVAAVNTFLHRFTQERRPEVKASGKRTFSAYAPKPAVLLYAIGAALLVAENGEELPQGGGGEGSGSGDRMVVDDVDWGPSSIFKDSTEYRAYGRRDEGDGDSGDKNRENYDDLDLGDEPHRWG